MLRTIFSFIALISVILLLVGFFSPKVSLFWLKAKRTRLKSFLIYLVLFVVAIVTAESFYKPTPYSIAEIRKTLEKGNVEGYKELSGRTLFVEGKIHTIKQESTDLDTGKNAPKAYFTAMVILDSKNNKENLVCFFPDTSLTSKLKVGENITFNCEYSCNLNGFVDCPWILSDCVLVDRLK